MAMWWFILQLSAFVLQTTEETKYVRTVAITLLKPFSVILLCSTFGVVSGIDPFAESVGTTTCFVGRNITGCSETLEEAYAKSEFAEKEEAIDDLGAGMFLFTRRNKNNPELLHKCSGSLPSNTYYRKKCKTIILIHGYFVSLCDHAAPREIKDQILAKGDYNVILVDWSHSNRLDVYASTKHSKILGKAVAFLMQNIMTQTNTGAEKFHLIGHSHGGQAAGFAGQFLKGAKVRRITALDPGIHGFNTDNIAERLDPSDARWVDVIHTDSGPCFPGLGDPRPVGHANFYVNGGRQQLSCFPYIIESLLKGDFLYAAFSLLPGLCSHLQSYQYFKTSINACECQFIGVECRSYEDFITGNCNDCGEDGSKCAVMGMDWEQYPRPKGIHSYFLSTDLQCPYCNNTGIKLGNFGKIPKCRGCKPQCFPKMEG